MLSSHLNGYQVQKPFLDIFECFFLVMKVWGRKKASHLNFLTRHAKLKRGWLWWEGNNNISTG